MSVNKIYIFFVFGLLLIAAGCGSNNQQGRPARGPVAVTVQEVNYAIAPFYEEYPATVKALQEVELRPQVSGYITGIFFKEGDKVKKGQKLYTIDQQQSQAAYSQALANLAVQEANLDKAKKDFERYKELEKDDAIARQQVDYAESAYTSAKQLVEAAKATVNSVQTNVRYSTIVAPFDGTIGISAVKLGASVTPGQTLLNTISSDDPMAVDVVIDQSKISGFSQILAKGSDNAADSTFRLVLDKSLYPHFGKLSFIDRAVDPQTGTIKIRVELPNPEQMLRPGMSGSLQVLSNVSGKSITIPFKAVTEQLGEFFVYVSDGSKVSQRRVKLGKQIGSNVVVADGLKQGEVIVVEGVQNLREGAAITVASPAAAK
tara:strand:+ start:2213 stop:3334 length:1122 start_codon:yes stop_codon:yes gene_type:complete